MTVWRHIFGRQRRPTVDATSRTISTLSNVPVSKDIEKNLRILQEILTPNEDFSVRRFDVFQVHQAAILYFSDLANQQVMNNVVLKSLMSAENLKNRHQAKTLEETISQKVLYHSEVQTMSVLKDCLNSVLAGDTVLFVQGIDVAYVIDTREIKQRNVAQPETERAIRAPRDGFVEILDTNLALIRYRLRTPFYRVKAVELGVLTNTKVVVTYIEGIANSDLVDEVMRRIKQIDIDGVLSSGHIEQFIEDNHWSPFPQVIMTERPDKAVSNLLEGRVSILCEGTPIVLIVPAVFSQFYQTVDDYSERFIMGTLVRYIRLVALMFSLVFPALYIAILSFNPELIPTKFAVAVASGRAGVPFPPLLEVLFLEISMEVLREATIRMPQQVGGALSIVGVLVVGQAAVEAGFSSPITVVVIALTTIGSFATPAYNAAIALRMLRFPLDILAGIFGLYGVMMGLILISVHLVSLKSFGVPYLTPAVPEVFRSMKDMIVRAPFFRLFSRPKELYTPDRIRQGPYTDSKIDVLDPARQEVTRKKGKRDDR